MLAGERLCSRLDERRCQPALRDLLLEDAWSSSSLGERLRPALGEWLQPAQDERLGLPDLFGFTITTYCYFDKAFWELVC